MTSRKRLRPRRSSARNSVQSSEFQDLEEARPSQRKRTKRSRRTDESESFETSKNGEGHFQGNRDFEEQENSDRDFVNPEQEEEERQEIIPVQRSTRRPRKPFHRVDQDDGYADEEIDVRNAHNAQEDNDDDDDSATRSAKLSAEKGFANSGILLSVKLDRFMSHDCFQYDFGPNVNIIQGPNGSGKSAIVAALQIGLLGAVNSTERGKKLDDVIKHGCDDCCITIKIINRKPVESSNGYMEPDLTYKHDLFGDVITIERKLRRGQGSTYAVKARNRFVELPKGSNPRDEICRIIDHFGFMVNNPVTVLTQTKSKEFLAKAKPADHFRLFREATLLGPLQIELQETKAVTEKTAALVKRVKSRVPEAEENLRKKELAHREAQEMKTIDARILNAELYFAWTIVHEEDNKLKKNEAKTANDFEPLMQKASKEYEKSQAELESKKGKMIELQTTLNEVTTAAEASAAAYRHSQSQLTRIDLERKRFSRHARELDAEIKDSHMKIKSVEGQMNRAREEHFAGQEQKSLLLGQIKDIDDQVNELQERIGAAQGREGGLMEQKLPLEDEIATLRRNSATLEREFEHKRRQEVQAQSAARNKDSIGRFGQTMPELMRRIHENKHRFSRDPVGPVGQFVSLDDESWAPAIEIAIGRATLRTFIVHNSHDSAVLQSLVPRGAGRPVILIANLDKRRYNIRREDCPDIRTNDCYTILETLTINNDAVYNYLVDQSQIDRNVLDGSGNDVTRLGWSRIPNLHTVWNKQCDRAYSRNGSNTFRNGPPKPYAQILTKDMRSFIANLREEARIVKENLTRTNAQLQRVEARLRSLSDEARRETADIYTWRQKITALQNEKSRIEGKLNQAENAFDSEPYEQEIASLTENVKEIEKQRDGLDKNEAKLTNEFEQQKVSVENCKNESREARAKLNSEAKNLANVQTLIAQLKSNDRHLKHAYEVASKRVHDAHAELAIHRGTVATAIETANRCGERPADVDSTEKPSAQWKRELKALHQRLETEQERRGGKSAAEIEHDYLVAKQNFDQLSHALKRVKFYVKALERGVKNRQTLLLALDKSLRKLVRANFRKFMATRGHSGSIKFKSDEGQQELHIVTQMATHRRADGGRVVTKDNRSLSGGEKSYTTLCFILALAEICQNPVRVMDEIDVFQDEGTRHASFKTLVDFCTKYLTNRQIIIITPHPLPHLDANEAVRIQKLAAPRRQSGSGRQTHMDQYFQTETE